MISSKEKKWRAQNDASTLAAAAAIKADKPRMAQATKAAKTMLTEVKKQAQGLASVAKAKGRK